VSAWLSFLVLVPLVDQASKHRLRSWLGPRAIPIGVLGSLRIVQTRTWTLRVWPQLSLQAMWLMWMIAASALAAAPSVVPISPWAIGLITGGALSHAIEMSARGSISDYVCLRFWPAFNFADVAITAGAMGMAYELIAAVR
jgi:lipoprotein signal peptidase